MRTRWPLFALVVTTLAALVLAACSPTATPPNSLLLVTDTPRPPTTPTTAPTQAEPQPGRQWAAPPEMTIDPTKIYLATFKAAKGDITAQLFADKAPLTVNNFIFLARQGYYDNTTFHRVLNAFMAQGGDPTGTGSGGPGYTFPDEFSPDLLFNEPGLLAMANSGPNTNGSQFFITFVPTPHLNGLHTIFGKVVEGLEVLLSLTIRDPQTNPDYLGDTLYTVEITESSISLLPPPTATPVPVAPQPESGRPLADLPIGDRAGLYNSPPALLIDPSKSYVATLQTAKGDIVIALDAAAAPASVNNFVVLANLGYWDNFPINYAEPQAFVLTGSPAGDPSSDIGYTLPSELGLSNVTGAVGYWFRDDRLASSGSEFYIMLTDNPGLDAQFTVFGMVTEGLDVAAQLSADTGDVIESVTITEQ
ncbi:MAG: peptidylprolyl isomerase [Anaerolineales bacterium]|nr:peptidylprolyl isomerase [Anaerolineales bacterium]